MKTKKAWSTRNRLAMMMLAVWCIVGCLGCKKDRPLPRPMRTSGPPEKLLHERVGIVLPAEAKNGFAFTESLMALHVYARFDLPTDQLDEFLDAHKALPDASLLQADPDLYAGIRDAGKYPSLAWWQLGDRGAGALCAKKEWNAKDTEGDDWGCVMAVCVMRVDEGWVRLYLHYFEDPGTAQD